jgi:hypothetical protein
MSRTQSFAPVAPLGPPSGLSLIAYALGWSARGDGRTAIDNPFDADTAAARSWQDGWMAAPAPVATGAFHA